VIGAEPLPETLASRAARLFADYRNGDEAKMAELVALLTPILWHTVRAQRLDRESAEDVLQTTWLALVRSSASIADAQAVLQWLIVSARREAWRVVKKADRSEPRAFEADDIVTPPDQVPEHVVLRTDSESRLWHHIAQLPDKCRELLRVIAFADRPDYSAIAKSLGMPVGSIGPTRGRCLAKLRLQLAADSGWDNS
jgi:RNA polymerase sigma factor (sigma-70 family)